LRLAGNAAIFEVSPTLGYFGAIAKATRAESGRVMPEDTRAALTGQGSGALHRAMSPGKACRLQRSLKTRFAGRPDPTIKLSDDGCRPQRPARPKRTG